jgi:hypothetical protein
MDAETWLEYLRTSSQGLRKFLDGHHEIPASDYQRRVTNQQFADGLTRLVKLIEDLGAVYGAPEHWSDTKDDRLGDFPKHSRFMAEHIVGVLDSLRLEQPAEGDTLPKSLPKNKGGCKPKELTKNEKRALDLYNPNQPKKNRTQIYQTLGIADQKDKANKFSKLLQRVQAKHYLESEQKP